MTARPLIVAVVLLRKDGAALLQHRDDRPDIPAPGLWVFPGGHADPGESPLACAVRELEEETAYRAPRLDFLLSFEDDFFGESPVRPMDVFWESMMGASRWNVARVRRCALCHGKKPPASKPHRISWPSGTLP